jgi:cell wall-associated NlpC family hydrolase
MEIFRVTAQRIDVRDTPSPGASLETQLKYGEGFSVLDWKYDERRSVEQCEWIQIRTLQQVTEGWIKAEDFAQKCLKDSLMPTHRVCVPRTVVWTGSEPKSPPCELGELFLGSLVSIEGLEETFTDTRVRIGEGRWVNRAHLLPVTERGKNLVQQAKELNGINYVWGGNTPNGLDCSALVGLAITNWNPLLIIPRNVKDMREELGVPVPVDTTMLQTGDLVFWEKHVGIMITRRVMVHATMAHDRVITQSLKDVIEDQEKNGGGLPLRVRRIPDFDA